MKTSIKIKKFWYADVAADGGLGLNRKEIQIGQREASVQFNGSDASVSNYKNVLGDTLESSRMKGDKTMNFQLADLSPEVIADFTGGTASTSVDADSYDAPLNQNQSIEKSIIFLSDKNVLYRIPRASFDGYPVINDDDLHYYQMNSVVLKPTKANLADHGYDILKNLDANDITSFVLPEQTGAAVISTVAHTVAITVEAGTSPAALVAEIGVSMGASLTPGSGVATDYTAPVPFTVTSVNGDAQIWTVTVTVAV